MTEDSKDRREEPDASGTSSTPVAGQQFPYQQGAFGPAPAYDPHAQHTAPMPPYQQHYGAPGQPPIGPDVAAGHGAQPPRRRGAAGLIAGAIALALISGGIGGAVGALVSRHDEKAPVSNALNAPPPKAAPVANAPAGTVPAVAKKVLPSVVMIRVAGARAEGEGSGNILSSDGLILTNNHVASGAGPNAKMEVQFNDGSTAPATVVGVDPVSDLAVIKATGKTGLTPIELGTSSNLQVGQTVVAIGSPLGLAGTVTTGIVSALNRPVSTSGEPGMSQPPVISAIQTDAPINPGNSGGALVDMDGKLVGINTAIATLGGSEMGGQQSGSIGLGFAIPVDQARRVADQLIKTGHATYAQIGVTVMQNDPTTGARIRDVLPNSPAAKAGIPPGAIVTKVDDQIIDSGNGLIAAIRTHQPGDKVKVTYTGPDGRDPKTVEVTLDAAPAEAPR
ncbi:trypsin-like peptidase domain-containing protein [Nocardia sp. CDC159]|uniref:Trypsin-like peptidase domain-containing protein n=1 Tax=Nocardia pulmonis TaxID=2951408 RepID=A0A9X2E983_9NOCA|nr:MULTISPECIES: trypsin-like peptidase domain-containing protein [Nocardia]MCM6775170.1 trypsin-like peptidase domain-containing protein [Nocardia pulmonis]MCM6789640.1 trypsin-like peptidase domain-containing protein [Nocardia sp. CDC159]